MDPARACRGRLPRRARYPHDTIGDGRRLELRRHQRQYQRDAPRLVGSAGSSDRRRGRLDPANPESLAKGQRPEGEILHCLSIPGRSDWTWTFVS